MATAAQGKAAVGTIKVAVGDVKVIGVDGVVRNALVGERVFAKETIQTAANAVVQVQLENGRLLDIGRDSKLALDDDVLNAGGAPATAGAPAGQDIAAIQAQIAAGADPSKVAEATAAGGAAPGAGGADGGGGSPLLIEQANSSGEVTAGFNTGPAGIAFPEIQPELLPVIEEVPTVSVSVQVKVDVDVEVEPGQPVPSIPPNVVDLLLAGNSVVEGSGGGTKTVNFVLTLSAVFDQDVTVTYEIVPGSALTPSDFGGALTGTVVIPAGQTTFIIPVDVVKDDGLEGNEDFSIVLTSATNATISVGTATAVIIDDDVQANADTNWAQEDTNTSISGNAIAGATHAGAPSGAFADAADQTTAVDGTGLSVFSVNGATANVGQSIVGTYGTLVLNANGTYTYQLNNELGAIQQLDDGETLSESFDYTAVNGFGNVSSATLNITIFGTNDAPIARADTNWVLEDSETNTVAQGNVLLTLAHDGAPSGSFGDVADTDVDIEDLTVSTTGNFQGLYGTLVLNSDGTYTYTLNNQDEAVQALAEGQTLLDSFNYTATDGTASVNSTLTITIFGANDGPIVGPSAAAVSEEGLVELAIPDNDGDQDTTNDAVASGAISIFDPDGDPVTVTLSEPTAVLTSGGSTIDWGLSEDGKTLTGSIGEGQEIIIVTINDAGEYTVELLGPIDHPDGSVEDDLSFTVGVNASDGSGTSATTITVTVEDDSPVVTLANDVSQPVPMLTVDETVFGNDASASFASQFNGQFGADGEGNIVYSLNAVAGPSGLVDTLTGQNVVLSIEGGIVYGKTAGGDIEVFRVTVDENGVVTLNQSRSVVHDDPTDHDEATSPATLSAALVTLTATITDADDDTDSVTLNIGDKLAFEDDGPSVTLTANVSGSVLTDETNQLGMTVTGVSSVFNVTTATGNDGGTTDVSLVVTQANTGYVTSVGNHAITLVVDANDNNVVHGIYDGNNVAFTVSISDTGVLSVTQNVAIKHPISPDNYDEGITLNGMLSAKVEVTDGDGDKASQTVPVGNLVTFEDDGPSVGIELAGSPVLTLDESIGVDALDANAHLDDNVAGNPFPAGYGTAIGLASTVMVVTTASAGSDGADSAGKVVSLNVVGFSGTGIDSGLDTLSGANILLYEEANGDVTGRTSPGGPVIFAIRIANDGTVTVAQYQAIKHPDGGLSYDEGVSILGNVLQAVVTMTDNDGDTATSATSIGGSIVFQDDGPTIAPQNSVLANQDENTITASLNLDGGTDGAGAGSVVITGQTNNLAQAVDASGNVLTSGDVPLTYITVGGILYATTDGTVGGAVFSVTPDPVSGTYTVTMLGTLDAETITFSSNFGSTDPGGPNDPYTSLFTGPDGETQTVEIFGFGTDLANPSSDGLGVSGNTVGDGERLGTYFGINVDKVTLALGNFSTAGPDAQLQWSAWNVNVAIFAAAVTPEQKLAFYDSITIVGTNMFATVDGVPNTLVGTKVGATGTIDADDASESDTDVFSIDPSGDFNFLYIEGTNGSFKIEQISFESTIGTDPVLVNFTATATDGDLDTDSSSFQVNFAGTNATGGFEVVGTDADDVLNGGQGNDILTGGLGDDTFQWSASDDPASGTPVDTVTDFLQSAGDKLDLADLLQGENSGTLGSYLSFAQDGSNVVLSVKAQGAADATVDQVIVLQNVTMADLAGPYNPDSAGVIANLLEQQKLITG